MKKINLLSLIFTLLLAVSAVSVVRAQEPEQSDVQNQDQPARPFRLLQELGLSREQIQQIRRINQERRPIMQEAQRRWRMANRDLDLAIYADDSTEEQVKELLKAAQLAHAELLKERTLTEYLIRKVLTPEQLVKFRELREMLMRRNQRRNQNIQNNRDDQQPQRPVNRLQQRRNQTRQP
jgi:Spy/CpxP family protein refolding chaperone